MPNRRPASAWNSAVSGWTAMAKASDGPGSRAGTALRNGPFVQAPASPSGPRTKRRPATHSLRALKILSGRGRGGDGIGSSYGIAAQWPGKIAAGGTRRREAPAWPAAAPPTSMSARALKDRRPPTVRTAVPMPRAAPTKAMDLPSPTGTCTSSFPAARDRARQRPTTETLKQQKVL